MKKPGLTSIFTFESFNLSSLTYKFFFFSLTNPTQKMDKKIYKDCGGIKGMQESLNCKTKNLLDLMTNEPDGLLIE